MRWSGSIGSAAWIGVLALVGTGVALQLRGGWQSVPGDLLLIIAMLVGAADMAVLADSDRRLVGAASLVYVAVVGFGYWTLLDLGWIPRWPAAVRFLVLAPGICGLAWYVVAQRASVFPWLSGPDGSH